MRRSPIGLTFSPIGERVVVHDQAAHGVPVANSCEKALAKRKTWVTLET